MYNCTCQTSTIKTPKKVFTFLILKSWRMTLAMPAVSWLLRESSTCSNVVFVTSVPPRWTVEPTDKQFAQGSDAKVIFLPNLLSSYYWILINTVIIYFLHDLHYKLNSEICRLIAVLMDSQSPRFCGKRLRVSKVKVPSFFFLKNVVVLQGIFLIPLFVQDPSRATTGTLTHRSTQMSKSLRAPWSSRTSRKPGTSSSHLKEPLFPIRIGFIADLNPTFVISADPDQGAKPVRIRILARLCCHKKLNFGMKIYLM